MTAMTKSDYMKLFINSINDSCEIAEKTLGKKLDRNVIIRIYGLGFNGEEVTPEEFVDKVYINDTLFYRLIDLMVIEINKATPTIFARISAHPPAELFMCWNKENGPFKQLVAEKIIQK